MLGALGLGRRFSRIELGDDALVVAMGWAFRARIPLTSITAADRFDGRVISLGVHGWRGRWLVNGSWHGLVRLAIEPAAPSRVIGFPGRLRELIVSVEDPDGLVGVLRATG